MVFQLNKQHLNLFQPSIHHHPHLPLSLVKDSLPVPTATIQLAPPQSLSLMDPSDRSPRKQLQGPRPSALTVRKDSHQIRKPPVAPRPNPRLLNQHQQRQPSQPPPRAPVIIYTVSPKVIHTNPSDFMTLVQRLTGSSSSSSSSSSSGPYPFSDDPGAPSPAARYAAIEKAKSPKGRGNSNSMILGNGDLEDFFLGGVEIGQLMVERSAIGSPQGILSPGPGSLPLVPPSFFSPPSTGPNLVGFCHDYFSPGGLQSSRGFFLDGGLLPSPGNLFGGFPLGLNSPFPSIDIFNNFNSSNFDF